MSQTQSVHAVVTSTRSCVEEKPVIVESDSVFFRGSWQKRNRAVWSASLTPPLGLCHPISHSVKRGGDGFNFECPGVRPATFN